MKSCKIITNGFALCIIYRCIRENRKDEYSIHISGHQHTYIGEIYSCSDLSKFKISVKIVYKFIVDTRNNSQEL